MRAADREQGLNELRTARREARGLFWMAGLFSVFVNLLMLTGPLFMLQVYDRVLGSRSEETLFALAILMTFLFAMMGVLDYARGRILARVGAGFQARLDKRVFSAVLRKSSTSNRPDTVVNNLRDLEAVQRLLSSPVFTALYDLPWTPVFLTGILIFHTWLGMLALGGGLVLVLITVLNQLTTRGPSEQAQIASLGAEHLASQLKDEAEMVRALGMADAGFARWSIARNQALSESIRAADATGRFSVLSKTFRLFLQSAMLGLGAYLVLQNELTAGAMIAGSILLGRALAPVDLAIGQWHMIQRARSGWRNLGELLAEVPEDVARTQLPRPKAHVKAENLTIVPPGQSQASLRMVNFEIIPGQALGVIGPSGAGKSTLARAITGVWRPAGGKIRLDGAALDQFDPAVLGEHIGYLPQRVQLFEGTIAENIAGLALKPDDNAVVSAARKAAAHDMILHLPDGYDTRVSSGGGMLSGGQMQRIGLARALYGGPVLLVLDEPNSNLDNDGTLALNNAIRAHKAAGNSVMIMAHRPDAIRECEILLVIDGGQVRGFGPRDEVLEKTVRNASEIQGANKLGGVT
ncbi:type I secretion system permease/ATPase [Aliiroseovarius subalbicans]|uniref:type I secretion system permease/ATPase n=1 Tax=Aliiroseovarius subalbicans TaxID=2925840 RepID=UPI001F57E298|nr:type I secretion system permease/ATPase [Aliiroseovarius subalbicans]MCI2399477.1 type I secretion system permease/ATPase [Aliiroseovarius subalbicans]